MLKSFCIGYIFIILHTFWRGAGVAERGGLENRCPE